MRQEWDDAEFHDLLAAKLKRAVGVRENDRAHDLVETDVMAGNLARFEVAKTCIAPVKVLSLNEIQWETDINSRLVVATSYYEQGRLIKARDLLRRLAELTSAALLRSILH